MTTIKITELSDIGANLTTSTLVPVVNMAGVPVTQKTNVGNIANLILEGAGVDYPEASVALLAQTVSNAAQPNITSVGTLTNIVVSGNASINGNITSNGTAYLGNISTTGEASITTLVVGSSSDLGSVTNVIIEGGTDGQVLTTDGDGNLSWTTVSSGNSSYGDSNVVTLLSAFGSNTITTTGNISAGNVSATTFTGALSGAATTAGTVTTNAQPNITSVGTLSSLTASGNVSGGNLVTGGEVVANGNVSSGTGLSTGGFLSVDGTADLHDTTVTGNLSATGTATLGNITTGGTITSTGTATLGNVTTGGFVSATGNVTANNINTSGLVSATGNANVGNVNTTGVFAATISSTGTATLGNITTGGTITSTGTATLGNLTTGGFVSATGNVTGDNINTSGLVSATGNANVGNVNTTGLFASTISSTGTATLGNVTTGGTITSTGTATLGNVTTGGFVSATGNVTGGNFTTAGNISASGVISATGNVTGLNIVTGGNVQATGDIAGGNLYAILGEMKSNVANIVSLLVANVITASGNVTGGNILTVGNISATGNITANNLGNITTINLTGSNSNVLYGNGVFAAVAGAGGLPLANGSSNFNIAASGGNVTIDVAGLETWTFDTNGNLTIPGSIVGTATVDIDNRASGNGADINLYSADDILIQARDRAIGSTSEGGDINIFAGDSAEDSDTSAGDITIEAGRGGASNIDYGGTGGFVSVSAGQGGNAVGANFVARPGGSLTLNAGDAGANNGNIDLGNAGGDVTINAGDTTSNGDSGGSIILRSGDAGANALAGQVQIIIPSSDEGNGGTWTFNGSGILELPNSGTIGNDGNNIDIGSTSAISLEASTVVNIYTDTNGNAYQWQFGDDGNLTLPTNTSSINYANGSPYGGGGGSANTGNVTFDDNIVIGTGDEYGGAGLFLATGPNGVANLQYLQVRGGDFPTHIHLDTGNNAFYDQYFGADSRYVKLEANGNVVINADDYNGNSGTWSFTTDGNLILAGGNSVIQSVANSSLDPVNPNVSTMVLTPDPGYSSQSLVLDPTAPGHIHLRAPGTNIEEPLANIFLGGENSSFEVGVYNGSAPNLFIHSGGNTWTFGNDGTTTFPAGNITSGTSLQFTTTFANVKTVEYQTAGVWDLYVEDSITGSNTASSRLNVTFKDNLIDKPQVYIENTKESDGIALRWTFDENGNLNFPRDVAGNTDPYLSIVGGSTPTIQSTDVSLAGPANLAIQSDYLNLSGSTGNRIAIYADNGEIGTEANMVLYTNLADPGNIVSWTLDTTGNLTVPGNLVIAGNTSVFGTNASLLQPADNLPLLSVSSGSNGGVSSLWVEDIGNVGTSNIAAVYANPTSGSGIVRIAVGQNGGNTGPNLWDFGTDGNLTIPGSSGGFIKTVANASIGIAAVDNGTNNPAQLLSMTNAGAATSIVSAYATNATIQTNATGTINTWSFNNAGNLTLPTGGHIIVSGGLVSSGASPAPSINGFSITNSVGISGNGNIAGNNISATGNVTAINLINTVTVYANLPAATTAGIRAFISDANLAPIGNFGVEVSGGGGNYVPVFSDGANWCIG